MPRVLVSGGTGVLGRELVPRLAAAGYAVRVMSRRPRPDSADPAQEWAQAELRSGSGLAEAVSGVDLTVHAASSLWRSAQSDVRGTERLLEQARTAGVGHFLYVSIVGIDRIPLGYYKTKLAAEARIEGGGVPWSILRATQFHTLIDSALRTTLRFPIGLLPTDFRFQPIDPGEVAERVRDYVGEGAAGRLPDLGGPEVHTLGELARTWAEARRLRRRIVHLPLPGKIAAGFRAGDNCAPENAYGRVTWADWVRRKYIERT
jgi:uncharacterized protein YbjT (DUF2867 family)